ncbi:unnamed protein product, partial [Nesidiocoris tenuis]
SRAPRDRARRRWPDRARFRRGTWASFATGHGRDFGNIAEKGPKTCYKFFPLTFTYHYEEHFNHSVAIHGRNSHALITSSIYRHSGPYLEQKRPYNSQN